MQIGQFNYSEMMDYMKNAVCTGTKLYLGNEPVVLGQLHSCCMEEGVLYMLDYVADDLDNISEIHFHKVNHY